MVEYISLDQILKNETGPQVSIMKRKFEIVTENSIHIMCVIGMSRRQAKQGATMESGNQVGNVASQGNFIFQPVLKSPQNNRVQTFKNTSGLNIRGTKQENKFQKVKET